MAMERTNMNDKKTKFPLALAIGASVMVFALPVLAGSDMQKRVEMLEQELQALKTQLQKKEQIKFKKNN